MQLYGRDIHTRDERPRECIDGDVSRKALHVLLAVLAWGEKIVELRRWRCTRGFHEVLSRTLTQRGLDKSCSQGTDRFPARAANVD
jgi:hypothetical protein